MGFKVPTGRVITLEFDDDSPLDGLTVTCRSTSSKGLDKMGQLPMEEAMALFLDEFVIEWDLVNSRGKAIPVSAEALRAEEPWIGRAIWGAWLRGLYGVPGPLGDRSNSGVT